MFIFFSLFGTNIGILKYKTNKFAEKLGEKV